MDTRPGQDAGSSLRFFVLDSWAWQPERLVRLFFSHALILRCFLGLGLAFRQPDMFIFTFGPEKCPFTCGEKVRLSEPKVLLSECDTGIGVIGSDRERGIQRVPAPSRCGRGLCELARESKWAIALARFRPMTQFVTLSRGPFLVKSDGVANKRPWSKARDCHRVFRVQTINYSTFRRRRIYVCHFYKN